MKVETYKIKGWKEKETGLLVSENEEWILVKHIPVDYVIDGFKLYRKKFIKSRKSKSKEQQIRQVLELKKVKSIEPESFKFSNAIEILNWSEEKYGLFEFQDNDETDLIYGKINRATKKNLIIDMIKADGRIEEEFDFVFSLNKIRTITFESDYFESIRLLMNNKLKK